LDFLKLKKGFLPIYFCVRGTLINFMNSSERGKRPEPHQPDAQQKLRSSSWRYFRAEIGPTTTSADCAECNVLWLISQ
jgi:hypothetical protein